MLCSRRAKRLARAASAVLPLINAAGSKHGGRIRGGSQRRAHREHAAPACLVRLVAPRDLLAGPGNRRASGGAETGKHVVAEALLALRLCGCRDLRIGGWPSRRRFLQRRILRRHRRRAARHLASHSVHQPETADEKSDDERARQSDQHEPDCGKTDQWIVQHSGPMDDAIRRLRQPSPHRSRPEAQTSSQGIITSFYHHGSGDDQ
jgi:hypothetical protein